MAAFLLLLLFAVGGGPAKADFSLSTAGAPVAPADAESAKKDPFVPLSSSDRREMVREFKALLSMGAQTATSTHWVGNSMADCQNRTSSQETFCRKCEIQMGNSQADYVFYNASSQCRLRDVEVTLNSADKTLLKELKPHARAYAGSREGQFYIDEDEHSGQSNLRFVWKRGDAQKG